MPTNPPQTGHGSLLDPPNRFDRTRRELDLEQVEWDTEYLEGLHDCPVEYLTDTSRSIVSENDSPDIPFRYSLNPYRGCAHGCAYCYRPPKHATTSDRRILYGARASGRERWGRNRPGNPASSLLMESQQCVMAP